MERHYGMDWLRIGAFALLILYHVGLAFVPWPFAVKVAAPGDWTTIPMLLLNPWRLSLLFVVSGYASGALLAKLGTGRFARARAARLFPPLVFGMAVVCVPQPWVELVTQHGYAQSFAQFVAHDYFSFRAIDGVMMPTWMHLWFVVYLLAYTMLVAALATLPASWHRAAVAVAERVLAGPLLLPLGIVGLALVRGVIGTSTDTHRLIDDWSAHAVYLPMLLFGLLLHASPATLAATARQRAPALALAAVGFAALVAAEVVWPGTTPIPHGWRLPYAVARAAAAWGTIVALLATAHRSWNRDARWRPVLVEAVFPLYLVHQTIIVVVGYWLLPTALGTLARFLVLVAATAGGSWAFYALGRRMGPLRPWIGLAPFPAAPQPRTSGQPLRNVRAAADLW